LLVIIRFLTELLLKKKRLLKLTFLMLFWNAVPYTAAAQTIPMGNTETLKATAFNPKTESIYAIWSDSLRIFLAPDYTDSKLIRFKNPEPDFHLNYKAVCADTSLYFIHKSGGLVYHLTLDSLIRIDHSFKHNMQANSNIFVQNDTIFRFGGYGMWSNRDFLTFFNSDSKEWEIIPPYNSTEIPDGIRHPEVVADSSNIYVFSGLTFDVGDPSIWHPFKQVWKLSLALKKWENLGAATKHFDSRDKIVSMGDEILFRDNSAPFVIANPIQNSLTYFYPKGDLHEHFYYSFQNRPSVYDNFYHRGKFYILRYKSEVRKNSAPEDGELVYEIISREAFLGNPIRDEALYQSSGFPIKSLGIFLAVFAAIAIIWLEKNQKKECGRILIGEKSASFKGVEIPLDTEAVFLLKGLLKGNGELKSQEALELLGRRSLSGAHLNKILNEIIADLNFRLKTLTGAEEDYITSSKSSSDRRLRSYFLNHSKFRVL
jgi:hypothetical protein